MGLLFLQQNIQTSLEYPDCGPKKASTVILYHLKLIDRQSLIIRVLNFLPAFLH